MLKHDFSNQGIFNGVVGRMHIIVCNETDDTRDALQMLTQKAQAERMTVTVQKQNLTDDATQGIRIHSVLSTHILDTMVDSLRSHSPLPMMSYVVIGQGMTHALTMDQNPMMQIQAQKHGWQFSYLNAKASPENLMADISQILKKYFAKAERTNAMKETKIIINALNQTQDNDISIKENMVRYCVEVEGYTQAHAEEVVSQIIRGTADFTTHLDGVGGKSRSEIAGMLKARLAQKLQDLPDEDANKILENLYLELRSLSADKVEEIATQVGEADMKAAVEATRQESADAFAGLSREEKMDLIVEAVENCASLSALLGLSEDKHSFRSARDLDDTISTATMNADENTYILDEYELIKVKNYSALAEYITAQHQNNRQYSAETSPYEVAVSTAAQVETHRIRLAAIAGMITFDNAVKLIAKIVMIALALVLAYVSIYTFLGTCLAWLLSGHPILGALVLTGGILLTYDGVQFVIRNREKVGAVLSKPIIWLKDLAIKLFRGFCRIFHTKTPEKYEQTQETEQTQDDVSDEMVEDICEEEYVEEDMEEDIIEEIVEDDEDETESYDE